jgi:hypothetical protein
VSVSAPAAADALVAIVGRAHVATSTSELAAAAVDGVTPRWLVRPGSVDEVARIMTLAASEGLAVAPGAAAPRSISARRLRAWTSLSTCRG